MLNRPSSNVVNEDAIDRLPQTECNVLLDEVPTIMETRKAVKQLSSGKAPGADAIPAFVYKAGGIPMAEKLTELFHCMWRKEAIPQEFKDASIIHLHKQQGNPQVCDNHRGISLLSIAGKILAKILLNPLNVHFDQKELIQNVNVDSEKRDTRHDLHSKTASGKMPRTECRYIHDVCGTLKLLTQLVVVDSRKSWPSLAVHPVHSSGAVIS